MTHLQWHHYSQKLQKRIRSRYHAGSIRRESLRPDEMRWIMGEASQESIWCKIYIIIDETDGILVDTKFETFAPPIVIGLLETLCSLLIRKNYNQAGHITAQFVEEYLRDSPHKRAFTKEEAIYLSMIFQALECALVQCLDIELPRDQIPSPVSTIVESVELHTEFPQYTETQKREVIEAILEKEIRPFIALDEGGVEVVSMAGNQVKIRYTGNCISCYSATGSTLQAIQSILQQRIHPAIQVIPDLTELRQGEV